MEPPQTARNPLKRRFSDVASPESSQASNKQLVLAAPRQSPMETDEVAHPERSLLLPREFERLSLDLNSDYVAKLSSINVVRFMRPTAQKLPTVRYYTIFTAIFRTAIEELISRYLKVKLYEAGSQSIAATDAEVTQMSPIIADTCMAALYAKLRNIHQQYRTYSTRYTQRPSYTKEVELPVPLADAIQNFGVFTPLGTETFYVCVPTYPEGVQNEGRSNQNWSSFEYESYVPYMKELGIKFKSVDTRLKPGTAWWTYKVTAVDSHFDFRCIFSTINYSDHSALLAAMFARVDDHGNPTEFIEHRADDEDQPVRLREVPDGYQLKAFSALCQGPVAEWSQYTPIPN